MNHKTLNVYRIHDRMAEGYGPLYESPNHEVAMRNCRLMKLPFPEDYVLQWVAIIEENGNMLIISPEHHGDNQTEWECKDIYNQQTVERPLETNTRRSPQKMMEQQAKRNGK